MRNKYCHLVLLTFSARDGTSKRYCNLSRDVAIWRHFWGAVVHHRHCIEKWNLLKWDAFVLCGKCQRCIHCSIQSFMRSIKRTRTQDGGRRIHKQGQQRKLKYTSSGKVPAVMRAHSSQPHTAKIPQVPITSKGFKASFMVRGLVMSYGTQVLLISACPHCIKNVQRKHETGIITHTDSSPSGSDLPSLGAARKPPWNLWNSEMNTDALIGVQILTNSCHVFTPWGDFR